MATREQEDRFAELVTKRDATYRKIKPIQEELDAANIAVQEAQKKVGALTFLLNDTRGRQEWLDLKAEIAQLSRLGAGRYYKPQASTTGVTSLWNRLISKFR